MSPVNELVNEKWSLWLRPPDNVARQLDAVIAAAALSLEEQQSAHHHQQQQPRFLSHITALGNIGSHISRHEAEQRLRQAIEKWKNISMSVAEGFDFASPVLNIRLAQHLSESDNYFTAVTSEVVGPSQFSLESLWLLRCCAAESFDVDTALQPPYVAHLSIAYGELSTTCRQNVIEKFESEVGGLEFECSSVSLVASSPDPACWKVVTTIPLSLPTTFNF